MSEEPRRDSSHVRSAAEHLLVIRVSRRGHCAVDRRVVGTGPGVPLEGTSKTRKLDQTLVFFFSVDEDDAIPNSPISICASDIRRLDERNELECGDLAPDGAPIGEGIARERRDHGLSAVIERGSGVLQIFLDSEETSEV